LRQLKMTKMSLGSFLGLIKYGEFWISATDFGTRGKFLLGLDWRFRGTFHRLDSELSS